MNNRHVPAAALLVVVAIVAIYLQNFFPIFGFQLSADTAVWGQFGDYVGGTLNPVLSFISIVLLIRSLTLQNDANEALRIELKNSEKTENFRTFSTLFFSMIESQKNIFRDFSLEVGETENIRVYRCGAAVLYIEQEIEKLREKEGSDKLIVGFLETVDSEDQIFGILRAFYITVRTICEKLRDNEDFGETIAKEQLITLINFTDFAQLRLIIIGVQFLNYKSCVYLKSCKLFEDSINEIGLRIDMY